MTNKSAPPLASLARLNEAFAKILLAVWPAESKSWGVAFASECTAIEAPQKQFRWLLGGIPILLRESFKSFLSSLGRPIGVGPSDVPSGSGSGRTPRTPRLLLAFLFLIFVALLAQPQTRTVFRSVSQAYAGSNWDTSRWPEVQRLQNLAEENLQQQKRDPQLLAFASLLYTDEQKRLALAEAAIQADPSLAWTDYQNAVLPWNDTTRHHGLSAHRIDRMLAADPGNAILYLLRAESISLAYQRRDAQADPGAHRVATWGAQATNDPSWLAAMDSAFKAPHYDAYDAKLFHLSSDVMQRYGVNDPRILSSILGRRPLVQYVEVHKFAEILLAEASGAQRAGDANSAIKNCSLILEFAQRVRAGNFYRLEIWIANDIESQAYPKLQSLYENVGRREEARNIAVQLEKNRAERVAFSSAFSHLSQRAARPWSKAEWAALLMQASVLGIWVLLPISLVIIVVLCLWSGYLRAKRRTLHALLCVFSDLCPAFLVLSAAILFLTYLPFDAAYRQLLHAPFSPGSYEEYSRAAYAPFALPMSVEMGLGFVSGPHGRLLFWFAATVVLILLAAILGVRQISKRVSRPKEVG